MRLNEIECEFIFITHERIDMELSRPTRLPTAILYQQKIMCKR